MDQQKWGGPIVLGRLGLDGGYDGRDRSLFFLSRIEVLNLGRQSRRFARRRTSVFKATFTVFPIRFSQFELLEFVANPQVEVRKGISLKLNRDRAILRKNRCVMCGCPCLPNRFGI